MKVTRTLLVAIWSVVLCWGAITCHAQEAAKPEAEAQKEVAKKPAQPPIPCHLEFAFSEMQDGKKINTRHYSMNLNVGSSDQIKIGTRVPIEEGGNAGSGVGISPMFQYIDNGTSIWSLLQEQQQNIITLQVRAEISNFASADTSHPSVHPIIRQLSFHGSTVVTFGKAVSIATLDDPNSTHQFQLEVTVTKLN